MLQLINPLHGGPYSYVFHPNIASLKIIISQV